MCQVKETINGDVWRWMDYFEMIGDLLRSGLVSLIYAWAKHLFVLMNEN